MNQAGVIPVIFASSLLYIPSLVVNFTNSKAAWAVWVSRNFVKGDHPIYVAAYAALIIFFTYFYVAITFNPDEVADNMKKQGGFIPGVRPGKPTSDYIDNILTKITLPGSVFLAIIAITPTLLGYMGVTQGLAQFFGGTSLLIVVGVALDTLQQIESHLLMRHYDGFMKNTKLKSRRY